MVSAALLPDLQRLQLPTGWAGEGAEVQTSVTLKETASVKGVRGFSSRPFLES